MPVKWIGSCVILRIRKHYLNSLHTGWQTRGSRYKDCHSYFAWFGKWCDFTTDTYNGYRCFGLPYWKKILTWFQAEWERALAMFTSITFVTISESFFFVLYKSFKLLGAVTHHQPLLWKVKSQPSLAGSRWSHRNFCATSSPPIATTEHRFWSLQNAWAFYCCHVWQGKPSAINQWAENGSLPPQKSNDGQAYSNSRSLATPYPPWHLSSRNLDSPHTSTKIISKPWTFRVDQSWHIMESSLDCSPRGVQRHPWNSPNVHANTNAWFVCV